MLQIKFGYDWTTGCGDIRVWKCLPTDALTHGCRIDRYTISSPLSLRLRWAKVYYKLTFEPNLWAFGSGELKKALISFGATGKLICIFVLAYAKSRFSHNEAHILEGYAFTTEEIQNQEMVANVTEWFQWNCQLCFHFFSLIHISFFWILNDGYSLFLGYLFPFQETLISFSWIPFLGSMFSLAPKCYADFYWKLKALLSYYRWA